MNSKAVSHIAAALLGLAFITFGINHFFPFLPNPGAPPEGSPPALFFGALYPTGYLSFIKAVEIVGGILVLLPLTRSLGLLALGPVVVNIIATHVFLMKGQGLFAPPVLAVCVLSAVVLWTERGRFAALMK